MNKSGEQKLQYQLDSNFKNKIMSLFTFYGTHFFFFFFLWGMGTLERVRYSQFGWFPLVSLPQSFPQSQGRQISSFSQEGPWSAGKIILWGNPWPMQGENPCASLRSCGIKHLCPLQPLDNMSLYWLFLLPCLILSSSLALLPLTIPQIRSHGDPILHELLLIMKGWVVNLNLKRLSVPTEGGISGQVVPTGKGRDCQWESRGTWESQHGELIFQQRAVQQTFWRRGTLTQRMQVWKQFLIKRHLEILTEGH